MTAEVRHEYLSELIGGVSTRPMRGVSLRASIVCQFPSRNASNQAAKSIGP